MGRKSKLTPDQWAEVDRRVLEGEAIRALAREFGISDAAIRERIAKAGKLPVIQEVAAKLVEAERSLAALPLSSQITARNLAQKLLSISDNLATAAEYGAKTAHRLQALANSEVVKVDDAEPLKSLDALKNVGVLTKLANDSASIALNLLAANKDAIKKINDNIPPDTPDLTVSEFERVARQVAADV
jgi:transposase-like protein